MLESIIVITGFWYCLVLVLSGSQINVGFDGVSCFFFPGTFPADVVKSHQSDEIKCCFGLCFITCFTF